MAHPVKNAIMQQNNERAKYMTRVATEQHTQGRVNFNGCFVINLHAYAPTCMYDTHTHAYGHTHTHTHMHGAHAHAQHTHTLNYTPQSSSPLSPPPPARSREAEGTPLDQIRAPHNHWSSQSLQWGQPPR